MEVAELPDGSRAVRDSKDNGHGPIFRFTATAWQSFILGVKDGQFE